MILSGLLQVLILSMEEMETTCCLVGILAIIEYLKDYNKPNGDKFGFLCTKW